MEKKILVADDDPSIIDYYQECFANLKHDKYSLDLTYCQNGQEALNHISHKKPDLFFLDLIMPNTGGMEVIHTLDSEQKMVPIVLVSGMINPKIKARCIKYGITSMIKKPFTSDDLSVYINRHF